MENGVYPVIHQMNLRGCSSAWLDLPAGRQGANSMSYYVYIIRSKLTKKYYTGMTSSILRRLQEHNQQLSNTRTTKYNTDYDLVYCQEVKNRNDARKLEKYMKSGTGREIRNEIIEENFGVVAQPG